MFKTLAALLLSAGILAAPAGAAPMTADAINQAQWTSEQESGPSALIVKAQVLLDRAGFSPGVIDGNLGENFSNALATFQQVSGLEPNGKLDEASWAKLNSGDAAPAIAEYAIMAADQKGPFVASIPKEYEAMAELKYLGYRGPREELAEKFHMGEDLLKALNPSAAFEREGETIIVAKVKELPSKNSEKAESAKGGQRGKSAVAKVVVQKSQHWVRAMAADGSVLAHYPASVGSEDKPAPSGSFEVTAVAVEPTYTYNPDFKFKGQKSVKPLEIAPGPNGPVGMVWIALSAETYGIHGTAEPSKIGKHESHGCVRLTNWDALALARLVKKETVVEFVN